METENGWRNYLAEVSDLDMAKRALIRETVIRQAMADTGEPREVVAEAIDAAGSMGQEAVLDLTEGEPTTLAEALSRYVEALESNATNEDAQAIVSELSALLVYPWPGVPDADALTREVHEAYVRLAPGFGVQVVLWHELEAYQRDLALAVVNDLVARGVLTKRAAP